MDDEAAVVRREDVSEEWIAKVNAWAAETGLAPDALQGPDTPAPKFSHAWVIGGAQTTTGAAVLVSDPQLPVHNPSMLYEFHASGATFNVRGAGVAGSPIILVGFNQQVAWGLTALGADQGDLFLLETDPDHPDQYHVDGQWLDMTRVEEVIKIKGSKPVMMTVRKTIYGPVMSEFALHDSDGREVALRRVPVADTERSTFQAALGMIRARSCDEFADALPDWQFPTANCIFGDHRGNIGYWSLGAFPIRSPLTGSDGSHAQDGSTRKGMWRGMIPYDVLPHCKNPKRGFLVTANHRTIQSFYRIPFGGAKGSLGDTDRGLRIKERILEQLSEKGRFSPADVLSIQHDTVNVWKREIVRLGFKTLKADSDGLSSDSRKALRHLRRWYERGAGTDMAVPGTELTNEMKVNFRGELFGLVGKYGAGVSGLARFVREVRARDAADPSSAVPESERLLVDQVLAQTWSRTRSKYGSDPQQWHALAKEELGRQKLGYMQSLDGFPSLDQRNDVQVPLLITVDRSTILSQKSQAYTQFVSLHDTDQALSILPIGNSDNPNSSYRFSTYGGWAKGQLHPAPLSRSAVNKLALFHELLAGRTQPVRIDQPATAR